MARPKTKSALVDGMAELVSSLRNIESKLAHILKKQSTNLLSGFRKPGRPPGSGKKRKPGRPAAKRKPGRPAGSKKSSDQNSTMRTGKRGRPPLKNKTGKRGRPAKGKRGRPAGSKNKK